jgi:hypothetical protein
VRRTFNRPVQRGLAGGGQCRCRTGKPGFQLAARVVGAQPLLKYSQAGQHSGPGRRRGRRASSNLSSRCRWSQNKSRPPRQNKRPPVMNTSCAIQAPAAVSACIRQRPRHSRAIPGSGESRRSGA